MLFETHTEVTLIWETNLFANLADTKLGFSKQPLRLCHAKFVQISHHRIIGTAFELAREVVWAQGRVMGNLLERERMHVTALHVLDPSLNRIRAVVCSGKWRRRHLRFHANDNQIRKDPRDQRVGLRIYGELRRVRCPEQVKHSFKEAGLRAFVLTGPPGVSNRRSSRFQLTIILHGRWPAEMDPYELPRIPSVRKIAMSVIEVDEDHISRLRLIFPFRGLLQLNVALAANHVQQLVSIKGAPLHIVVATAGDPTDRVNVKPMAASVIRRSMSERVVEVFLFKHGVSPIHAELQVQADGRKRRRRTEWTEVSSLLTDSVINHQSKIVIRNSNYVGWIILPKAVISTEYAFANSGGSGSAKWKVNGPAYFPDDINLKAGGGL